MQGLLPDIWGEGALLAFSGLDGPTHPDGSLVLHTGRRVGEFSVRLPMMAEVVFSLTDSSAIRLLLGDCMRIEAPGGWFVAAFLDAESTVGEMPPDAELTVDGRSVRSESEKVATGECDAALYAGRRGGRWVISGKGPIDANLFQVDLDALLSRRAGWVSGIRTPAGLSPGRARLLRKALSVIKVNCHSACGAIRRRWTTPDRWPHRRMWLWDSAFQSMGLLHADAEMAKDAVRAMLDFVQEDGSLAHMIGWDGKMSRVIQPPILGWAVAEIVRHTGDKDFAAECLPLLVRYLDWDRTHRDRNGNGIPEWHVEKDPLCRCGECGLDNLSVFDHHDWLDAPDFGSYLAHDYACAADLADLLGDKALSETCRAHADRIGAAVRETLWCEEERSFLFRGFEGTFVRTKTVAGFVPLFAGIASRSQAEALDEHINNPATFGAPLPIPSESLDSSTFCKDMWRGPSWLNMTYLTYLGLKRYGFHDTAAKIREQVLDGVQSWYERTGCLWEYYDCLDETPPGDLDRKQRLSTGEGIAPISDYHWTASVVAAWLPAECATYKRESTAS
jgi:hypothetical protein